MTLEVIFSLWVFQTESRSLILKGASVCTRMRVCVPSLPGGAAKSLNIHAHVCVSVCTHTHARVCFSVCACLCACTRVYTYVYNLAAGIWG